INLTHSVILFSLVGIILAGSMTIFSVTSIDLNYFFRFLMITLISICFVATIFYLININRILSAGWIILVANILLVMSVEIFGQEINGSRRWLDFGFLSLQPSEFMKISYAIFTIQYLRFYSFKFSMFRSIFLLGVLFLTAVPIIIQPDLGTGVVYIAFGVLLLFICGMDKKYFYGLFISLVVMSPVLYNFVLTGYQKGRIINWFSSEGSVSERWNILQSEISIGSGQLFGEGFLASKQNEFNFLPEADTDFIFSIYAEQFGFVGVLAIFILLALFLLLTLRVLLRHNSLSNDLSPYYLGTYFIYVIGFSFLINILMVSGLIPVVGLPLPFFTKGGSSLLCFSIMLGFIFSARGFLRV
ncbi:MAG: FtsW/RodA/SpoVE family cell cycle protein, partial [Proteobacteria bacterium]|nr:FtsW/RodA/SpoVE family cell cycle protein [Pseudomonadota bacterium]